MAFCAPSKPVQIRQPKHRLHKASGQGVVTLSDGPGRRRDFLLGPYGSKEAKAKYHRLLEEWELNGRRLALPEPSADLTINELVLRFLTHLQDDGHPQHTRQDFIYACKPLVHLYGDLLVSDFSPKKLKVVRELMLKNDICRSLINRRIRRIVAVFAFGVEEEILDVRVHQAIATVKPLRRGKGRETAPVRPVDSALVEAIKPYVNRHVWGLIELMRHSGMRPTEACTIRWRDIDQNGPIWTYTPEHHKTEHLNKIRKVSLGPKCQLVLRGFLTQNPDEYLFSPKIAMAERSLRLRAARKSPVQPSQRNRGKRNRRRAPGEVYNARALANAVRQGCKRAGVEKWHPNQLRHTFATMVRHEHGLEHAQAALGHSRADVTQVYAQRNLALASQVAQAVG